MKYSDEILSKSFSQQRGLSVSERQELRESYLYEQQQDDRSRGQMAQTIKDFNDDKDTLNMPRHRMHGKCLSFKECPIDYKCRAYNPSRLACRNCELHETEEVCMKPELHNEKNLAMIMSRERIDLDATND